LAFDDLTLLSDAPVRVALLEGQQLVYAFLAFVPLPNVTTHSRTRAQLEQAVTAEPTINLDDSYVAPETIDIGGLLLTTAQPRLHPTLKCKHELLHFGYVTQWEIVRRAVYTH
jgi:hypothetical protein